MEDTSVTVLIISSSRPEVLRYCLKSFNEKLLNCKKTYFINEDVVDKNKTQQIEQICDELQLTYTINRNTKPKGPCKAIMDFAKQYEGKYFFIVEDDWELEDEIRVPDLYNIMDKYESVNEIILKYKNKVVNKTVYIDDFGYNLYLSETPLASPGLWRTSLLKKSYKNKTIHDIVNDKPFHMLRIPVLFPEFYSKNEKLSGDAKINWLLKDIGAYIIKSQHLQIRHLGNTWKTFLPNESNDVFLNELKYTYIIERNNEKYPIEPRPINGKIPYDKDYIDRQLKASGKHINHYLSYIQKLYRTDSLKNSEWMEFLNEHKLLA